MPKEAELRFQMLETCVNVFSRHGFLLIKTPIFENIDLLAGGDEGDNSKMMFKTLKRRDKLKTAVEGIVNNLESFSENQLAEEGLKFDQTVSLGRFFVNNRQDLPNPFKAMQIDEAFRAERAQKGRYKQFTQADIDIIGDNSNLAEIEVICAMLEAYSALGLNALAKVNSRIILNNLILDAGFKDDMIPAILIIVDKLEKIGEEKVKEEILALFGGYQQMETQTQTKVRDFVETLIRLSKLETTAALTELREMAKVNGNEQLYEEVEKLKEVIRAVNEYNPEFEVGFDASIVRGQGYYTGTLVEFCKDGNLAIGGGGRYDNMIEKFDGEKVSAFGASIGVDRVLDILSEMGEQAGGQKLALVYYRETSKEEIIRAKAELMKRWDVATFAFPNNFFEFERRLKLNGYSKFVKIDNLEEIKEIKG